MRAARVPKGTLAERLLRPVGRTNFNFVHDFPCPERDLGRKAIETLVISLLLYGGPPAIVPKGTLAERLLRP